MVAVKPFFYKAHSKLKGVCIGRDINPYIESLKAGFSRATLLDGSVSAGGRSLPDGPLYYTDAPRPCIDETVRGKYDIEDAISDCLRKRDRDGRAKRALIGLIADKMADSYGFRQNLLTYNRVPQDWRDLLFPEDPEEPLPVGDLAALLASLPDKGAGTAHTRRTARHPLARIMESKIFTPEEKLKFVADYLVGKKRKKEVSWAVRIGTQNDYTEINLTRWLEQNNAYLIETFYDLATLRQHFTATNRLKSTPLPELSQISSGYFKTLRAQMKMEKPHYA